MPTIYAECRYVSEQQFSSWQEIRLHACLSFPPTSEHLFAEMLLKREMVHDSELNAIIC